MSKPRRGKRRPRAKFRTLPEQAELRRDLALRAWKGRAEERHVIMVFETCRWTAWNLSQARETQQTPGLGDLWVTVPEIHYGFWFQTKHGAAKLTKEQRTFREHCRACHIPYHQGDRHTAEVLALYFGYATITGGGTIVLAPGKLRDNHLIPADPPPESPTLDWYLEWRTQAHQWKMPT